MMDDPSMHTEKVQHSYSETKALTHQFLNRILYRFPLYAGHAYYTRCKVAQVPPSIVHSKDTW